MKMQWAAILSIWVCATATSLQGVPTLSISDGSTTLVIADGSVGDGNTDAGVVEWNGQIGVWTVQLTSGRTKPAPGGGTATQPMQDIRSVEATSTGISVLTIRFSEDNYGPVNGVFLETINGDAGGSFYYRSYADPSNVLFGTTILLTDVGNIVSGIYSDSAAAGLPYPFALTSEVIIRHGRSTRISSFEASLTFRSVPDGGSSLILLGIGLVALAGLRRRIG